MRRAFTSQLPPQQIDTLQQLVTKNLSDPALQAFAGSDDFVVTSTERGVQRWEQAHLVAALDVLNTYQRERRARSACQLGGLRLARSKEYKRDPRTRMVELLKRWLRSNAGCASVAEDEVRGICALCRDILNHPALFPARNPRSFLQSVAEVYDHLQLQLKEVLDRDRTCAELAQRVLSLSRNLIADAIAYLIVAPTDLRQTDSLPSLEVVALWQSLPDEGHPLPGRVDPALQKVMCDAWDSTCGRFVAALVSTPWCVRMFNGSRSEEGEQAALELTEGASMQRSASAHIHRRSSPVGWDAEVTASDRRLGAAEVRSLIASLSQQLETGSLRASGFAGAFRDPQDLGQRQVRRRYVELVELLLDLMYLLSEVLVQFHRVGDGLGDYGMIRMSPWLHPILDAVVDKISRVKGNLEFLGASVDKAYVLARARGMRIEKPAPTDRMCSRGRACIERATIGRSNHVQALLQLVEELKARSAPERLPSVAGSLGDACSTLQAILGSAAFRASVGDAFPELPTLADRTAGGQPVSGGQAARPGLGRLQIEDAAFVEEADSLTTPDSRSTGTTAPVMLRVGSRSTASSGHSTATSSGSAMSSRPAPRPSSVPALARQGPPSALRLQRQRTRPASAASRHASCGIEVYLVTPSRIGRGLRRRGRRWLTLDGTQLQVLTPEAEVDVAVDLAADVEACAVQPPNLLRVSLRRLPPGASFEDGVFEVVDYIFEFDSIQGARAMHSQITALSGVYR